jgi:hypothetical protein
MEPVDELGSGGDSDWHLMLNAFQRALLNLRGLFRRTNGKEKLQQVESVSGVIGQDDGLTGGQLTSGMPMIPERLTDGGGPKTTNSGNYPLHSGNYVTTIESISQFPQGQTPHLQSYSELQCTGEFASDDMWEEFFTIRPDFNRSNWDTLLIDLDRQMTGIGSGT